jgi:hypothetical protein
MHLLTQSTESPRLRHDKPAPSKVGLDLISRFAGRIDIASFDGGAFAVTSFACGLATLNQSKSDASRMPLISRMANRPTGCKEPPAARLLHRDTQSAAEYNQPPGEWPEREQYTRSRSPSPRGARRAPAGIITVLAAIADGPTDFWRISFRPPTIQFGEI